MVSFSDRVRDKDDARHHRTIYSTAFECLQETWDDLINPIRALSGADSTSLQKVNSKRNSYVADCADPRPRTPRVIGMKARKKYIRMTKISVHLPQSITRSTSPPSLLVAVLVLTVLYADIEHAKEPVGLIPRIGIHAMGGTPLTTPGIYQNATSPISSPLPSIPHRNFAARSTFCQYSTTVAIYPRIHNSSSV